MTLDTSNPDEVARFVTGLSEALTKDMAEIRETNLDGEKKKRRINYWTDDGFIYKNLIVEEDDMGRLVLPAEGYRRLMQVQFCDTDEIFTVAKTEPRYEGEYISGWTVYLNKGETHVPNAS